MAKVSAPGRMHLRAYARRCSASHVAVGKAIEKGTIKAGWDAVNEEIIISEADKEWGSAFMAKKGVTPRNPATEKQRAIAEAINEAEEKKEPVTRQEKKLVKKAALAADEPEDDGEKWAGGEIPLDASLAEALRIERIQMARQKKMQADELEGLLVRKTEINKQLFVAGLEIRKALERFPVTVIDKVLAARNRTAALNEMEDEMQKLLEQLTERITTVLGEQYETDEEENEKPGDPIAA